MRIKPTQTILVICNSENCTHQILKVSISTDQHQTRCCEPGHDDWSYN